MGRRFNIRTVISGAAIALATGAMAVGQPQTGTFTYSTPEPLALPAPAVAPQDVPYPGLLSVSVDATDLERRIYWINQTIPVSEAGEMRLHYAQWLPGHHNPSGPIYNYAGLKITANGEPVPWKRDPADVFTFIIDVPQGARQLDIEAQYLTPVDSGQGGNLITDDLLRLQWYATVLYPAGHYTRQIIIEPRVKLPEDWDYAVALETDRQQNGYVVFDPVSFEVLADSPLVAGRHSRKIELDPDGRSRVTLNVFADAPRYLETTDEIIGIHREMVVQADRLFGARHFDHYDFLFWLSSELGGAGLEHQRSSENGVAPNYFRTWETVQISRDLLPHEYIHSWNGKYRRPADLWTPTFNWPMQDSLLWVYEGQTQYWDEVLSARAGFRDHRQAIDSLANTAAAYENRVGREWRPLIDTTNDPIIAARRAIPWNNWQRSEDYYSEGTLIWFDVDTLIRELSDDTKSLDDFASAFFGMNDGDWGQLTYTYEDIVQTLNAVQPYDWDAYLSERLNAAPSEAPLEGFERAGWRLVYRDEPNETTGDQEDRNNVAYLGYSIGATINSSGEITYVYWGSPVFEAGLRDGVRVMAVNGEAFSLERMKDAVAASAQGEPIVLMLRRGEQFVDVTLDYNGGHRYAHLERIEGARDRLSEIFSPL